VLFPFASGACSFALQSSSRSLAFSQPFADDCSTYSTVLGHAICGILVHLHSGFDVWASGDAFVGIWPYRMYLGFLPRQYVYAVFGWCLFASGAALGVALRSSTCPSWLQSYGSLGIFQASACALRFLPRTGFGTFSGAVFFRVDLQHCSVALAFSSTSIALRSFVVGFFNLPCSSWWCLAVAKWWLAFAVCLLRCGPPHSLGMVCFAGGS
jgi:hypothetical protein